MAFEAGAELQDMEMVQFHPTGMAWPPGMRGILVTERRRSRRKGESFATTRANASCSIPTIRPHFTKASLRKIRKRLRAGSKIKRTTSVRRNYCQETLFREPSIRRLKPGEAPIA